MLPSKKTISVASPKIAFSIKKTIKKTIAFSIEKTIKKTIEETIEETIIIIHMVLPLTSNVKSPRAYEILKYLSVVSGLGVK